MIAYTDRLVLVLTVLAIHRDIVTKVPGLPADKKPRSSSTSGAVTAVSACCWLNVCNNQSLITIDLKLNFV